MNPELEEFAKLIAQHVRDETIKDCDRNLDADVVNDKAMRWKEVMANGSPVEMVRSILPDIIDDTIFNLLIAIDNAEIKLAFTSSNGKTIDLTLHGGHDELAGWYAGYGWRDVFSKERFVDYLSGIDLDFD